MSVVPIRALRLPMTMLWHDNIVSSLRHGRSCHIIRVICTNTCQRFRPITIGNGNCHVHAIVYLLASVKTTPLLMGPFIDLLDHPWMIGDDNSGAISGMND
jgi:hypothetical protein